MSQDNTLFDLPEVESKNNELPDEDDFFDKLDAVEVDYTALGQFTLNTIKYLAESYTAYIGYGEKLKELQKTLSDEAEDNDIDAFGVPEVTVGIQSIKESFRARLLSCFTDQFKISVPMELREALTEDFDYGNAEKISELFMQYTNNGDTDAIERDEKIKAIGQFLYRRPESTQHSIRKKKISIVNFFYTEKCTIFKEHRIGYSSSNWDKYKHWIAAIRYFANEQNLYELLSGYELIEFYDRNSRESEGAFEKRESEDSELITSTKLLKNGKMELEFRTEQLARLFWDDWIIPAQNRG